MAAPATYAPNFTVRLDGHPLPTAMRACVMSVRHQDGIEGADRVEVTLANERLQWLDHPLLQRDNVYATYHTAGVTHEARRNMAAIAARQILDVLAGRRPPRLLNPQAWPAFQQRFARITGQAAAA